MLSVIILLHPIKALLFKDLIDYPNHLLSQDKKKTQLQNNLQTK